MNVWAVALTWGLPRPTMGQDHSFMLKVVDDSLPPGSGPLG